MKIDITQIIIAVLYAIPWSGVFAIGYKWWKNSKYSRYIPIVKTAVQYAEQVLANSTGNDKRIWVENYVEMKTKGKLSKDDVEKLIESAVLEMNKFIKAP